MHCAATSAASSRQPCRLLRASDSCLKRASAWSIRVRHCAKASPPSSSACSSRCRSSSPETDSGEWASKPVQGTGQSLCALRPLDALAPLPQLVGAVSEDTLVLTPAEAGDPLQDFSPSVIRSAAARRASA